MTSYRQQLIDHAKENNIDDIEYIEYLMNCKRFSDLRRRAISLNVFCNN